MNSIALKGTASAPGRSNLSRLDGWPMRSPADASPLPLRTAPHGSGPTWIATPSSYRTCTDYSLPVSRRTAPVTKITQTALENPRPSQPQRRSRQNHFDRSPCRRRRSDWRSRRGVRPRPAASAAVWGDRRNGQPPAIVAAQAPRLPALLTQARAQETGRLPRKSAISCAGLANKLTYYQVSKVKRYLL
jgi:hypothetical protein